MFLDEIVEIICCFADAYTLTKLESVSKQFYRLIHRSSYRVNCYNAYISFQKPALQNTQKLIYQGKLLYNAVSPDDFFDLSSINNQQKSAKQFSSGAASSFHMLNAAAKPALLPSPRNFKRTALLQHFSQEQWNVVEGVGNFVPLVHSISHQNNFPYSLSTPVQFSCSAGFLLCYYLLSDLEIAIHDISLPSSVKLSNKVASIPFTADFAKWQLGHVSALKLIHAPHLQIEKWKQLTSEKKSVKTVSCYQLIIQGSINVIEFNIIDVCYMEKIEDKIIERFEMTVEEDQTKCLQNVKLAQVFPNQVRVNYTFHGAIEFFQHSKLCGVIITNSTQTNLYTRYSSKLFYTAAFSFTHETVSEIRLISFHSSSSCREFQVFILIQSASNCYVKRLYVRFCKQELCTVSAKMDASQFEPFKVLELQSKINLLDNDNVLYNDYSFHSSKLSLSGTYALLYSTNGVCYVYSLDQFGSTSSQSVVASVDLYRSSVFYITSVPMFVDCADVYFAHLQRTGSKNEHSSIEIGDLEYGRLIASVNSNNKISKKMSLHLASFPDFPHLYPYTLISNETGMILVVQPMSYEYIKVKPNVKLFFIKKKQ